MYVVRQRKKLKFKQYGYICNSFELLNVACRLISNAPQISTFRHVFVARGKGYYGLNELGKSCKIVNNLFKFKIKFLNDRREVGRHVAHLKKNF